MRLFIAIRLNEEMKSALKQAQKQMRSEGVRGNFTPEENLHLTMAFIGEHPDPDAVLDALETVSFTPFDLSLEGFGSFGDLWWAGLNDSPALNAVVKRVRRALSEAQIPFDKKHFRPHITLIRRAKMAYAIEVEEQNSKPGDRNAKPVTSRDLGTQMRAGVPLIELPPSRMCVETISLMRSERGKHGMIYTEIGAIEAEPVL